VACGFLTQRFPWKVRRVLAPPGLGISDIPVASGHGDAMIEGEQVVEGLRHTFRAMD